MFFAKSYSAVQVDVPNLQQTVCVIFHKLLKRDIYSQPTIGVAGNAKQQSYFRCAAMHTFQPVEQRHKFCPWDIFLSRHCCTMYRCANPCTFYSVYYQSYQTPKSKATLRNTGKIVLTLHKRRMKSRVHALRTFPNYHFYL